MKVHKLKVIPENWAKYSHDFTWSLRFNDRGFSVGDYCHFKNTETGETHTHLITDILDKSEYGLKDGYAILTLEYSFL